jgi:1,4-alpha-glucan branching enzyme
LSPLGAFTFVLHSHLPYARQAGRWPHGEEWLHEAAAETYAPLIRALEDLADRSVPARLTLSLTPILLEQLADPDVRRNFHAYLDEKIAAASADVIRFEAAGDPHFAYLATYYADRYRQVRQDFLERWGSNLVPAFRRLEERGVLEVITCAATHGYLPLLDRDESIQLQLRTALAAHRRHMGRTPRAIWLPECAYRPAYVADDGRVRPGIESLLAGHGLRLFFAETHMVEGGKPVGVAAGEAIGPYGDVVRRYVVPFSEAQPARPATSLRPYFVNASEVAVAGRENRIGLQVWSSDWGYPGDFDYREFHKKDGISGMQYWRITGSRVDLAGKDPYHPDWAQAKVQAHADHFAGLVTGVLAQFHAERDEFGCACANYDTELFGHWWFEGVDWLRGVLERLAASETVDLTTASSYLEAHPPDTALQLPEGSWGAGGAHFVWDNADTHWVWPIVHDSERRMTQAVSRHPSATGETERALNMAARELLLLQASDWPFLITTGQAREYAVERFKGHVDRFHQLLEAVEAGGDADLVDRIWERDKVFPDIDYRWFAP